MAQSLEDSRARERHLLLAVSHDLRTPLTSIRGFAEAIKDGAIEDSGQAADVIIAESRRLERLVGDLLDLTKLEAHQMSIAMRPTDAAEVVTTTAEGFRPAAAKSGHRHRIARGRSDRRPSRNRPSRRWRPIPTGSPSCWPTSSRTPCTFARSRGHRWPHRRLDLPAACVITVDDDGPGIAPGDLERVFERFYQADRGPNRLMGSGLGLAIVAELATAMGGRVRAESPFGPDGGSRFEVWLRPWITAATEPAPPVPTGPRA